MSVSKLALIDVDGVLADFVGYVLERLKEECGCKLRYEDIGEKHMFTQLNDKEIRIAEAIISKRGFAHELPIIMEGKRAVSKIQKMGYDVLFVTAPWIPSKTWCYDRARWLHEFFGANKSNIIFTHKKDIIAGDVFIDDYPPHVDSWKNKNTSGLGYLLNQPWNSKNPGWDWDDLLLNIEWENGQNIQN